MTTLNALITKQSGYFDAYLLLGRIYEKEGKKRDAEKIYNAALALERVPESFRKHIRGILESLKNP